jgi:hypothetical protein
MIMVEQRGKERQPYHMIDVAMAQKQIHVHDCRVAHQLIAKKAQPGASIENEKMLPAANFNAGRIATVTNGVRTGTGNAPPNAPESNGHWIQSHRQSNIRVGTPITT